MRQMLVARLHEPTTDGRTIESLLIEPGRFYPVAQRRRRVELRLHGDRVLAAVPWWWRRQLTLAIHPDDLDWHDDGTVTMRDARVLGLAPGELPW